MDELAMTHGDAELLLPWYVNGTLADAERQAIEMHLDSCEDCRENVQLLRQVDSAVRERSPAPIVPQPRVSEFIARLDAVDNATVTDKGNIGWLIAASVAIITLATILFYAGPSDVADPPALFETATSTNGGNQMGYLFEIQFAADTTIADQHRVLAAIGASEIKVDESTGAHQVLLQLPARSLEELEEYTAKLRAYVEVDSAQVVALQLPVRREE